MHQENIAGCGEETVAETGTLAVKAHKLYKVFGRRANDAVHALEDGATRNEIENFGTAAVIDASFEVKKGEIFVVMGLSGSGKSTLIRMLNGLLEPTSGTVTLADTDISGIPAAELREVRRRNVSMVFQHFALLPHRTVLDNAAYALEVQGVPRQEREERANRVIDTVGLGGWGDKLPDELSGGMKQRVGLARALAADTDILLMDEAFSALDPLIRREMQEQLVELHAGLGKTIVFITHDLNEAMFLGNRIAVMRDGRIVQVGTPEDILTDPANDYVAQFVQDVDRARVLSASSAMETARSVVSRNAGPRAALRDMRDLQTSAAFVVGPKRKLIGAVRDRDVMKLVTSKISDLETAIDTNVAAVSPNIPLADLYEVAVENDLPIAVIDDDRRLLGVIPRVTLLAALGNIDTENGDPNPLEPPPSIPTDMITYSLNESATDGIDDPEESTAATGGGK